MRLDDLIREREEAKAQYYALCLRVKAVRRMHARFRRLEALRMKDLRAASRHLSPECATILRAVFGEAA